MSEYNKLKEEFDRKVKELRENCPHEELTEPQEVFWGYGRTAAYSSRYCERCNKQMEQSPWTKGMKLEPVRDKR